MIDAEDQRAAARAMGAATTPDVLTDWVEESCRAVAPKRLVRELDGRA